MFTTLGLIWGLGSGSLLVGYGLFFRRAGLDFRHPAALVFYVIPIAAALLPLWLHANGGVAPLRPAEGVWLGTLSSGVGALIYSVFVYWYNKHVDDGLLIEVRKAAIERRRRKGLDDESGRRRIERLSQPSAFAGQVFVSLALLGLVSSGLGVMLLI